MWTGTYLQREKKVKHYNNVVWTGTYVTGTYLQREKVFRKILEIIKRPKRWYLVTITVINSKFYVDLNEFDIDLSEHDLDLHKINQLKDENRQTDRL